MTTHLSDSNVRERELFLAALEVQDPSERLCFIAVQCGGDGELQRRVESLLQEEKSLDGFLSLPAIHPSLTDLSRSGVSGPNGSSSPAESVGSFVGRYKLLQEIGEGGCGVVYMADQQEPIRRRVAVKVIKAGMDTKSVIARFEAERQALALMDHPNIARVLDAGATSSGRPFFVMELVRGVRINTYCDENTLPTRQRLELFIKACRAIQHAHQKGIIHRDIKPSNILVTMNDGMPEPKVIDFGIAKAIDQPLTDKTVFTAFEQFIGTPAYMSPEQAEMSSRGIDTRSDIYSLGVVLYELLTGRTPFDGKELAASGVHAMRQTLRETEPVPPSTRVKTLPAAEASDVAFRRNENPHGLHQAFRGDLDWIVMKAVAKDRNLRYETADALATDVQRYLDGDEVLACAPSPGYRLRKFYQRHRLLLISGVSIVLVLALAAAICLWQALRATRAERSQAALLVVTEKALSEAATHRDLAERERLKALRRAYNADMNLIPQALKAENFGRVIQLLDQHTRKSPGELEQSSGLSDPDMRQWEWRYFRNQARSDAAFALPRQLGVIQSLAISADARWLASCDRSGSVKLWDLLRRSEIGTVAAPGVRSTPLAFSPNGEQLALCRQNGLGDSTLAVWSTSSLTVIQEVIISCRVQALAFVPDGSRLLVLGEDNSLHSWSLGSKITTRLSPGTSRPGAFPNLGVKPGAFSEDAKWVAYREKEFVHVVEVEGGVERASFAAFDNGVACIAFSPNGELIAVSPSFTEAETEIRLFSASTGRSVGRLVGHSAWVPGMTFSPDGKRLISTGADQTVRIWDLSTLTELTALRGHLSEARAIAITKDGKLILTGGKDGSLFGWDASRVERRKRFEMLPVAVNDLVFFPDGQSMLSVNRDGGVSLWDASTLRERERLRIFGTEVSRLVISPDGQRVYAVADHDRLIGLDWQTRSVVIDRELGGDTVLWTSFLGLMDEGQTLVSSGNRSGLQLRSLGSGEPRFLPDPSGSGSLQGAALALSPQAHRLAIMTTDSKLTVVSSRSGKPEFSANVEGLTLTGAAFSPDGNAMAASFIEGFVRLWDLSSPSPAIVLHGHLQGVRAVAFSPDGERLASASARGEAVKLWDVRLHHDVATFAGDGSLFSTVRFSPDGRLLIAISTQGKAHLWRAPSLEELDLQEPTAR